MKTSTLYCRQLFTEMSFTSKTYIVCLDEADEFFLGTDSLDAS
jgi:hypothetical protein